MVLMKKETSARRLFSKRVDKRSRAEMTAYLSGHFRYNTMNSWNRSTTYACNMKLYKREVGTAAPYWFSPAVSAEPPPEPDLHVSAYPAPSAITITVLEQV